MAKNDTPEIPGLFDDLPEEAPQEQIAKISLRSWRTHLASIRTLDRRIEKLIDEAVKQALAQGRKLTSADIGRVFQRHPELRVALDKTMQQLNDDLTATIEQGSKDAWLRANTAADAVVAAMANNNAQLAALLNAGTSKPQNDRALRAFQQREMQGLKLSDRVWRATEGMKLDMERAIEVALAEGVPAQKLSERVRELLKEPHRLYRRVRDKDGNLKLSQAAQKYHPGTGVYRSSYKNAMRVARTEVNMAYQASDSERWTRSWWVKGIRVSLSNNHTSPDSKGRPAPLVDICDELAGDYPADFKFTGWHPQCRCFATAITCEYSDIREYYRRKRAGEDMTTWEPPGKIKEPPSTFRDWLATNRDRLTSAEHRGTTPFFIRDNAKYTGAKPLPQTNVEPTKKTIQEIAAERHATRTPEIEQRIRDAWAKHNEEVNAIRAEATAASADINAIKLEKTDTEAIAIRQRMADAVASGNVTQMKRLLPELQAKLKKQRDTEAWLGDIIPDVEKWHKDLTATELANIRAQVMTQLQKWQDKGKTAAEIVNLISKTNKYTSLEDGVVPHVLMQTWNKQLTKYRRIAATDALPGLEAFVASHPTKQLQGKLSELKEAIKNGSEQGMWMHYKGLEYLKKQIEKKQTAATSTPAAKAKAPAKPKVITKASDTTLSTSASATLPDWAVNPKTAQPYSWATEENIAKTMAEQGVSRELALIRNRAINGFTHQWDWEIRHLQQGMKEIDSAYGHTMKEIRERAKLVEEYIAGAPKWDGSEGATYRGIAVDKKAVAKFKRQLKSGKPIDMLGTSSWSTERGTAASFASDNFDENFTDDDGAMCLFVCKGRQNGTSIRHISHYRGEEEVICSNRSRWRITNIRELMHSDGDFYEIEVELIE